MNEKSAYYIDKIRELENEISELKTDTNSFIDKLELEISTWERRYLDISNEKDTALAEIEKLKADLAALAEKEKRICGYEEYFRGNDTPLVAGLNAEIAALKKQMEEPPLRRKKRLWSGHFAAQQARIKELEAALVGLVDAEECTYDHHGYCQTHRLNKPCEMAIAREALEDGK